VWCGGYPPFGNWLPSAAPSRIAGLTDVVNLSWKSATPTVARAMASGIAIGEGVGMSIVSATAGASSANAPLSVLPGANVTTRAVSAAPSAPPVTVTFPDLTQAGSTTLTPLASCTPLPPSGFKLGNPPQCFDLTSTATFPPPATVCFTYQPSAFTGTPELFHFDGVAWRPITKLPVNTVDHIICGEAGPFSPFALFEKTNQPTLKCVIGRATAAPNVLKPANRRMVRVIVSVTVTDACGAAARCRIVAVKSNEHVKNRNIREDASNNSSTQTVKVTVPRHK
jgi:hypothetical protein